MAAKAVEVVFPTPVLTHRGPVDLRKWVIFNNILMSPKSLSNGSDFRALTLILIELRPFSPNNI